MKKFIIALTTCMVASYSVNSLANQKLKRISTVPLGAEITGLYIHNDNLFFNAQHPADSNAPPYNKAVVGYVKKASIEELVNAKGVDVPDTDSEKMSINLSKGYYSPLFFEGDFADEVLGGMGSIIANDNITVVRKSNDPDFNAVVEVDANNAYLFTNWEATPGGMSRVKLKRDEGNWQVDSSDVRMLDFSSVNGTWINCFGTLSPWNTPLTSEELYFNDSWQWINTEFDDFQDQIDMQIYLGGKFSNPYDYGYIVEITDPINNPTPVKHYTMGRYSHENSVVMPDNKTVYLSDDGTGTVFFKFIADNAGDLSSGTLYAAKANNSGRDSRKDSITLEWIELAKANNSKVSKWIREYDGITPENYNSEENPFISDAQVEQWAQGKASDDRAAFLESRKAATAKGATAEFRKMEGVNINYQAAKDGSVPYLYMAMSGISKTMSDDKGDLQFDENKCGVVYKMKLDESYNVSMMEPAVSGGEYNKENSPNACPTDSISNPDNLLVLSDGSLIIGEDTGNHENNMLWHFK